MKISVISRWHNEAFLAPFFLGHYAWADEIIIMLDKTTTDESADIIRRYPNTRLEYFDHGGKLNDRLMADMMSDLAATLTGDWVIYVDADELAFPIGMEDPRVVLARADGTLIEAWFRWVYRHVTDTDLDPARPAIFQRRHGGEYRLTAAWESNQLVKSCIVKPATRIRWEVGQHRYGPNPLVSVSTTRFDGAHWQMADVEMAIKRTIERTNATRLSEENMKNKWAVRNFTEELIRVECKSHENDPQVF